MSEKNTFYLVREEILPEAIKKTIKNSTRKEKIETKEGECYDRSR